MVYKGHSKTYDFRKFKAITVSGNEMRNNIINMIMQMMNINICQNILENLKVRQVRKILT